MRKLIFAIVMASLLAVPTLVLAGEGQSKVDVCHVTSTYDFGEGKGPEPVGHVITIADPAFQSHLDHGDPDAFVLRTLSDGTVVCKEPSWVLIETVVVPSNVQAGGTSTTVLDASGQYAFQASGTWTQYGNTMDAEYSISGGTVYDGHYPPNAYLGVNWADLRVDGAFVHWGDYNPAHVYWLEAAGTGATVNFSIFEGDTATGTVNPGWYGDNSGSLSVEIYEWK